MNGVSLADKRRAAYTVHQRSRRNWLFIFLWLLDIPLANGQLLHELAQQKQFTNAIDAGTITLTSHPLGKYCRPVGVLVKQLLPAPFLNRIGHIRRTYVRQEHAADLLLQVCSRSPTDKAAAHW